METSLGRDLNELVAHRTRCVACGAMTAHIEWRQKGFDLYACPYCAMAVALDRGDRSHHESASASEHSTLTEESYTAGLLKVAPQTIARHADLASRRAREYRQFGRADRLLEVGCGAGYFGPAYAALGIEYVGLEIDDRLASVVGPSGPGWCVRRESFFDHSPEEPYDVIFASQVFEHITAPRAFLELAVEFLRPGGLLHLDVPNQRSLAGAASLHWAPARKSTYGSITPPHHRIGYTKASLEALFVKRMAERRGSMRHVRSPHVGAGRHRRQGCQDLLSSGTAGGSGELAGRTRSSAR